MATGSINPSILPAHPLLLFTAPNTSLKTNLEEQKIPFSVVARSVRIPELWIIRVKLPNAKATKVLVPGSSSAKFKCKRHQHFNICIRSALGAHSSQLSSMMPVMQDFVEPLCICPAYKGLYFPGEIEPKCLHYGSIKGHSIQDCNRLKFHTSQVYLKVRKEFKKVGETLLTGIPDTVTRSLAVHSTLSKLLQPVSKHHSVKRSTWGVSGYKLNLRVCFSE